MDGMVICDHFGGPGLLGYKKAIEPVAVRVQGCKSYITNHYDFIDLGHLSAFWSG